MLPCRQLFESLKIQLAIQTWAVKLHGCSLWHSTWQSTESQWLHLSAGHMTCSPLNSRAATFGIGEGLSEATVAASTQALATAVLDQGGISEDASLMRAAAQMYACAACIGTNSAATQLTQSVCKDMAQTPVPARSLPVHYPFHAACMLATGLFCNCPVQSARLPCYHAR